MTVTKLTEKFRKNVEAVSQDKVQGPIVQWLKKQFADDDTEDKGACYIEMPDPTRVIVTVRQPYQKDESKISIPLDMWRGLIAHTLRR